MNVQLMEKYPKICNFREKLCNFFANSIQFLFQQFLDFFLCEFFEFSIYCEVRFNQSVKSNWSDRKLTSRHFFMIAVGTQFFYDLNPMHATDVIANTSCGLFFFFLMNDLGFMTENGNNWPAMGSIAAYLRELLNGNITLKHIIRSIIPLAVFFFILIFTWVWPKRIF